MKDTMLPKSMYSEDSVPHQLSADKMVPMDIYPPDTGNGDDPSMRHGPRSFPSSGPVSEGYLDTMVQGLHMPYTEPCFVSSGLNHPPGFGPSSFQTWSVGMASPNLDLDVYDAMDCRPLSRTNGWPERSKSRGPTYNDYLDPTDGGFGNQPASWNETTDFMISAQGMLFSENENAQSILMEENDQVSPQFSPQWTSDGSGSPVHRSALDNAPVPLTPSTFSSSVPDGILQQGFVQATMVPGSGNVYPWTPAYESRNGGNVNGPRHKFSGEAQASFSKLATRPRSNSHHTKSEQLDDIDGESWSKVSRDLNLQSLDRGESITTVSTRRHSESEPKVPARKHVLYQVQPNEDGLYHCPFKDEVDCKHQPEKLKCNYDKHLDSHLKPYLCRFGECSSLKFSSTACLLRHEREAHGLHGHGQKPYSCHFLDCERSRPGQGFPRLWNLKDHMKRVHNFQLDLEEAAVLPSKPVPKPSKDQPYSRKKRQSISEAPAMGQKPGASRRKDKAHSNGQQESKPRSKDGTRAVHIGYMDRKPTNKAIGLSSSSKEDQYMMLKEHVDRTYRGVDPSELATCRPYLADMERLRVLSSKFEARREPTRSRAR